MKIWFLKIKKDLVFACVLDKKMIQSNFENCSFRSDNANF